MSKIRLDQLQDPRYLGDAVYVGHTDETLWLIVHDGVQTQEAIALDYPVRDGLLEYIKLISAPPPSSIKVIEAYTEPKTG